MQCLTLSSSVEKIYKMKGCNFNSSSHYLLHTYYENMSL